MSLPIEEIDTIIRIAHNPEKYKDAIFQPLAFYHIMGICDGKDMEKNNLKCSAPGESDWIKMMLHFKKNHEIFEQRFKAYLATNKIKCYMGGE